MIVAGLNICMLLAVTSFCWCTGEMNVKIEEEGHLIRKRFAQMDFEGYDTAHAYHELREGRFPRSAEKDIQEALKGDGIKRIRLDLTSGKSMTFNLQKVNIADTNTKIVYHTRNGRITKDRGLSGNCTIVTGEVEEGGQASFSVCNGLFGIAQHGGFEYFLHPVESQRSKRDVRMNNKVHVLWRRAASDETDDVLTDDEDTATSTDNQSGTTSDKIVVELALFSDAASCKKLAAMYPGREDEYLLTRVAATQALYSNHEMVGFDVQFKLKLIEYWLEDPEGYEFAQDLGNNLRSFRKYTQNRYFYDIHGLNTGISGQKDRKIGLATMKGACGPARCFNTLAHRPNAFGVYAHEIGHLLGFSHPSQSKCPPELIGYGSFMGVDTFKFSPCNKWELATFIASGKGACLFEETAVSKTPDSYQNLPSALPGQMKSPDELCDLYAGPDYVYYPPHTSTEIGACDEFYCVNNNPDSSQYGAMKLQDIPAGFPCKEGMFCQRKSTCVPLDSSDNALNIEKLRADEGTSEWSAWPTEWTPCTNMGGTSVTLRKRECKKTAVNIQPYCLGYPFQAFLCDDGQGGAENTMSTADTIQARGDEVCQRLKDSDHEEASSILPKATFLKPAKREELASSRSCMLKCDRVGGIVPTSADALLPDGTPCTETGREEDDLKRLGIQALCIQGRCVEVSKDCPVDQKIDSCGICNGDESRCVSNFKDSSYDVPRNERSSLEVIPAGSSNIIVKMNSKKNKGVELELWDSNGNCIIGRDGQYPNDVYDDVTPVEFAGTKWTFNRNVAFISSKGPTSEDVEIKALRTKRKSISSIDVLYAKPE